MEDYALDIIIGKGPSARSVRLDLSSYFNRCYYQGWVTNFSFKGQVWGVMLNLDLYDNYNLQRIVKRSSDILNIEIDDEGGYGNC